MNVIDSASHCREVLSRSGSSFGTAFYLLPRGQREAMTAFYAFCREVDDLADGNGSGNGGSGTLGGWHGEIAEIYVGNPTNPIACELRRAASLFGIKREHLEMVLEGVERDLVQNRYDTFADLYEYCYLVASAVGLVCVSVLGESSAEVEQYAELTGIAVQLTNIIRDVGEDALAGRIYLPLEDLVVFGVAEEDLLTLRMTPEVLNLLRFEARRALEYYRLAEAALPPRVRHKLFFAEALRRTYKSLLEKIVSLGFPVLNRRVSLAGSAKLTLAIKERLHPASWTRSVQ